MNPWAAPGNADEWIAPGYAEERELGRGTSGRVIAAVRETDGQRVAIKYLGRKLVRDSKFLAGFRAEAQLLRSLVFAHVVQLFDYVEQPGEGAAIVMELVNGVSLREMISRQGAASPESALAVLKGSLLGLAAAHGLGIVHRDYKPENVLIDDEGTSKLSDFGVAIREGRRRHAAVHGAGAVGRRSGQPGERHLRGDGGVLRVPDRQGAVLRTARTAQEAAPDRGRAG